jgi:hypothetical protein
MADHEAEALWNAFATDPAGTYQAVGEQLRDAGIQTTDPRLAEMYNDWQSQRDLAAYDQQVEAICATNPDIDPNLFHQSVAAANGDWDQAVQIYRANITRTLQRYGVDPTVATAATEQPMAAPDYRAEGLTPEQSLHRAIEEATRAARRR